MGLIKNALIEFEESFDHIAEYRKMGDLESAIQECKKYLETSPFSDFKFYYLKELGEIYWLMEKFEQSVVAYADAYDYITDDQQMFRAFARSLDRFVKNSSSKYYEPLRNTIIKNFRNKKIEIAYQSANLVEYPFPLQEFLSAVGKELVRLLFKDIYFDKMVNVLTRLEKAASDELMIILDIVVLERKRIPETLRTDKYCVTVYERLEKYYKAKKIAYELIQVQQDSVIVRSLFRLCRKTDDYAIVNQLLLNDPSIEKRQDFNILYELVYYYDKINNNLAKQAALEKLEDNYSESLPILRTLKNLYLRFGTFEDVLRVEQMIQKSFDNKRSTKKADAIKDSEASVWSALENSKRLGALANLTQGISHELGQPITNIRFMIQYHLNKGLGQLGISTIVDVFQTILQETERMGDLINRLSPITTGRNIMTEYNMMDRIWQRIKAEQTRLKSDGIFVDIQEIPNVTVYGDPSMFDQILSNLLINSIHALESVNHVKKKISIRVTNHKDKIRLSFQDNGIGISKENRLKIFEPFFTTKPAGQGQGLGLFIIWNLLKFLGGTIFLDNNFVKGTRFIIELPKEAKQNE